MAQFFSPTEANTWLLNALLYKYNTVLVPLCYEVSLQVNTLKSISSLFIG